MPRNILRFACLVLLLNACGKELPDYENVKDATTVVDGGIRIDAASGEASKINPIVAGDNVSGDLANLVFSGMLRYSPKLVLEGDLAESWKVSDGGKTFVFMLRPGLTFHDGHPLTAEDVVFTWKSIMDPKVASPRKGDFDLVDSVVAKDLRTVVVRYKKVFAPALESWSTGIIPKHLLEGKDQNKDPFNRAPVGAGPYKMVKWVDKQYVELAAFEGYYAGAPHIKRYILRNIPEQSTQMLELISGGIDCMCQTNALSPDQFEVETKKMAFNKAARAYALPGMSTYTFMGFNHLRPPFDDKRVRLALSHALDRDELVKGVLRGRGKASSGPYSPLMPAYDPAVKPVSYDPAEAGRLLDQAGWRLDKAGKRVKDGKPFTFKLLTNKGNSVRAKTVVIIQQQFRAIGVDIEIQELEWSVFLSNHVDKKDFEVIVMGWQLALDPDQYAIWHSSQSKDGQFNFISYKNAEVDRLLEEGRSTVDMAKRIAIYRKFHRQLADDQAVAFLYAPDNLSAVSRKFQGLFETEAGYDWYWPNRWYIPQSLQ